MKFFRSSRPGLLSVLIVLLVVGNLFAQAGMPPYALRVRAERDSAIYEMGQTVSFQVRLLENGKPVIGKELSYLVQGDGNYRKQGTFVSAEPFVAVEASLDRPGFLKCEVRWNDAPGGTVSALGGAGVDPLKISTSIKEPDDFDAFWNAKKEALAAMPMNPVLVQLPDAKVSNPNVVVFDIKVDCLGDKPVSGYFAKPKNAMEKTLPITISYHGAGVRSASIPVADAARQVLALDINAHGIENGQKEEFYNNLATGELKEYPGLHGNDREKIYFLGMYLRVIRSIQFMKSQPEWDGKTIAVKGSSQGGGQALVAAGIDNDVTFCIAYVPALCYLTGSLEACFDGWPGFLRRKTLETADPAIISTVPYFDAANFAKRIKAEAVLSTGFIDYVCSPTSVYVAYNNIKSPKQIFPTPDTVHAVPPKTREMADKLFWGFIENNRVAKPNSAEKLDK